MSVTSLIEPVNQAVVVSIPVTVLGRRLTYRSDWSSGRSASYRWTLDGLEPGQEAIVEIAGTRTALAADDSGTAVFTWDGRDSSGAIAGRAVASLVSDWSRRMRLGRWDAVALGLGGWMIDPCDHLDVATNRIQSGTGVLHGGVSVFRNDDLFLATRRGGRIESRFGDDGRHLTTSDLNTGVTTWEFGYGVAGLESLKHHSQPEMRCVRDSGRVTLTARDWNLDFRLDSSGRAISIVDPSGRGVAMEYSATGLLTRIVDGSGFEWAYGYDDGGRLVEVTEPGRGRTDLIRTRSEHGNLVRLVSAEGRESSYQMETLPDGTRVRTTHCCGDTPSVTRITDGRSETERPDGTTITTTRRGTATQRRVTLPSGVAFDRAVDEGDITVNGNTFTVQEEESTTSVTSPEGRTTAIERTDSGFTVTDAAGAEHRYTKDEEGRLASFPDGPLTTAVRYGPQGMVSHLDSSDGSVTSFEYDDSGWLTAQRWNDATEVMLERDGGGLVKAVSPPDRAATRFSYAAPGQLSAVSFPDYLNTKDRTVYERDRDGLTTRQMTTGSEPVTFRRGLGGEVEEVSGANPFATFEYEHGRVVAARTASGTATNITYDGSLITEIARGHDDPASVKFRYSSSFRLEEVSCGTLAMTYGHDADGLISSVGSVEVTRDTAGRIIELAAGAASQTYEYDEHGRLAQMALALDGETAWMVLYRYDETGRIGSIDDTQAGGIERYSYDDAGRLVESDGPASSIATAFDANGGVVSFTEDGVTVEGVGDQADRLLELGASRFGYGPGGVLTRAVWTKGTRDYAWDMLGRLVRVDSDGPAATTYQRNAFGSIVAIIPPDGPSTFLVPGAHGSPVAVTSEAGDPVALFGIVTASEPPLVAVEQGRTLFLVSDHRGSIRFVVDIETGEAIRERRYDPWGRTVVDVGSSAVPFGFAGGVEDSGTGLVHFPSRAYDPSTMRWMSRDPLLFLGGSSNLYAYADNDPINRRDPTGTKVEICRRGTGAIPGFSDAQHWWIRTANSEAGMFPDPVVTGGLLPNTVVSDHSEMGDQPGAECDPVENVDEECVDSQLTTNKITTNGVKYGDWIGMYGVVGGTCQTFVDDVLDSCSGGDYEVNTSDPDAYDHWYSPDVSTVERYNDGYDYSFNTPSPLWD